MNIFILDYDMLKSIQYLPDKHIVKMPVESTQILCNAYYIYNQYKNKYGLYKPTNIRHPCSLWAASSLENWLWLQEYTIKMGEEYKYRYSKNHKSVELAKKLVNPDIKSIGLTQFIKVVPAEFKHMEIVQAYREYFIKYKQHLKHYTKRDIPNWFIDL